MKSDLTPEQAAQRLLSLMDTLGIQGKDAGRQTAKAETRKLDPSSISWAFHDSSDKCGVLKWIVENVDASKNGLSDDELEVLEYLDRIKYTSDNGSSSNIDEVTEASRGALSQGSAGGEAIPSFELRARKTALEAQIERLSKYRQTISSQSTVLKNRVDQMTHRLAACRAEEEALAKIASSSDSEVARLTSVYAGVLDETALTAETLMSRLHAGSDGQSVGGSDAANMHFFYQNGELVEGLENAMQSHMENLGELVKAQMSQSDELPSPWKEFQPFATRSIAELLSLARSEHERIGTSAVELARAKLKLEIEKKLVVAVGEDVDKAYEGGDLLPRCQALESSLGANDTVSYFLGESVSSHASKIAAPILEDSSARLQLNEFEDALRQVNHGWNELAQHRGRQLSQHLEAAAQSVESQRRAAESILRALADEQNMLSGWNNLWATVSTSLDRDNAENERQKEQLLAAASMDGGRQGIHPDDLLALSLKQLLAVSRNACGTQPVPAGSATELAINNAVPAAMPLPRSLFSTKLTGSGPGNGGSEDVEMQEDEGSWLSEGTFTSWDALLSDAKEYRQRREKAAEAVCSEIIAATSLEQRMTCSLSDLKAALHGGDVYAGAEAAGILPVDVRDSLGELKNQAGVLRKRVTKATMLSEEPSKAAASDYAALFRQYY
ncbi:hypothetical protein GQ54DRAFT_299101 [Martensiomyces pterosporus]|nr:hypothetical protein GQ54DRAFT_299101 [Martensiomyces pterosporus]